VHTTKECSSMIPEASAIGTTAFIEAHRRDLARLASHRRQLARLGIRGRRVARQG